MDINSLSPSFRDALLNRNLVADSIANNGLSALLHGIGSPAEISNLPENVLASGDIVTNGILYKDLHIIQNKYVGYPDAYSQYSVILNPATNSTTTNAPYGANANTSILYKSEHLGGTGAFQGGNIREFNTTKNMYLDVEKQTLIDLNTSQGPLRQMGSYMDENNGLNVGGPSTNAVDAVGTVLNGQGLGVSSQGIVNSFDIRASLAGRALGAAGVINDTPLGIIGGQQLALALANNAAFGLQQETIGHVNTNPLSLLMGNDIIVPTYNITVPTSTGGKVLDFAARVLGFEVPVSLLQRQSSIFGKENPVGNIQRANSMIANTGKGQVLALFANISENKYKPSFVDERTKKGVNKGDIGSNPNLYAFDDGRGGVIDFLNNDNSVDFNHDDSSSPNEFNPNKIISQSNYRLEQMIEDSGFSGYDGLAHSYYNEDGHNGPDQGKSGFIWSDKERNKLGGRKLGALTGHEFTNPKSLLYKTQELFNTGKMHVLTTGKSAIQAYSQTNTAVRRSLGAEYMSKGSGVIGFSDPNTPETDPDKMFCRTWTTYDKYDQVKDLQKHQGLYGQGYAFRNGSEANNSVLDDNGFVKIGPFVSDNESKNYMFSIENLAWADVSDADMLECERGNGDGISRGRIMWFPPYDLAVSENVSVNLDTHNFIGRGEPIYTYNNTERTGNLSFKVIVDHPSYMNAFTKEDDDYIASFFAGCTPMDPIISSRLTATEIQEVLQSEIPKSQKKEITPQPEPPTFSVYFPNDSAELNTAYESGLDGSSVLINYASNGDGSGFGLGSTTGQGFTSADGATFPDKTNYGLNGKTYQGQTITMDGITYNGWTDATFQTALNKFLVEKCPACKVTVTGFASLQGNSSSNQALSQARADAMTEWLLNNVLSGIENKEKRIVAKVGAGETGDPSACPKGKIEFIDQIGCKVNRKVDVSFKFDPTLLPPQAEPTEDATAGNTKPRITKKIINKFYGECAFFEKLRQEDNFVYDKIREKIKFFHPAFHSTTPEGLNSRLTFLQQCTRQGPTNSANGASNLAFGRPPVCILRLGDFYHSKIMIESVGISYEPLVWDLNPEGIGVQPMIANVDLSFKFIGGQSLQGPIGKLQNAVSFNYFANTHVYDVRADKLVVKDNKVEVVAGLKVSTAYVEGVNPQDIAGTGSLNPERPTDQVSVANQAGTTQEQANTNQPDTERLNITAVNVTTDTLSFSIAANGSKPLSKNYKVKGTIKDINGTDSYQFIMGDITGLMNTYSVAFSSMTPTLTTLDTTKKYVLVVDFIELTGYKLNKNI